MKDNKQFLKVGQGYDFRWQWNLSLFASLCFEF